jgi:serine/threonine-protein kinase RsbW
VNQATRVVVTMPADASFVRLARLAAADAGSRAGFTIEEIDDLRIAVDELCIQVMGGPGTVSLSLATSPGLVEIEGSGPPASDNDFSDIARAIVAAVADEHSVSTEDGIRRFRLRKHSASA